MRSRELKTIILSLLIAGPAMAAEQKGAGSTLSLCQALELVRTGQQRKVTVSAIYVNGVEDSFLYDPQCRDGAPATWVEFAPGTKGRRRLERTLKQSDNRAYVQFDGAFFGPKPINPDASLPDVLRRSGRRYGHMGGYETMLLVHSIKRVQPVPKDIPSFQWPNEPNGSSAFHGAGTGELPAVSHAGVPLYPPMARIAGIAGTVQVEVIVKGGIITNTELKSSSPPILANAALENLRTWKFTSDANATFSVTYIYRVERKATPSLGNPQIEMRLPTLIKITAQPPKQWSSHENADFIPATGDISIDNPDSLASPPDRRK